MSKQLKILNIITTISFIILIINISSIIYRRNWIKTNAVVTSVLLPDGIVCGDFIDNNGIKHSDEPLFYDFKFEQIKTVKKVSSKKINKYIGKEITILYYPESEKEVQSYNNIKNYDKIIKNILFSSLMFFISLILNLTLKKHNKNRISIG